MYVFGVRTPGYLRRMRERTLLLAPVLVLLTLASCEKDDGEAVSSGVVITFRTDSGYTYMSDTVAQTDTLRIGAVITEGSDDLQWFYLSLKLDAGVETGLDTVGVTADPFLYETTHVIRAQPGSEELIFIVQEPDGDITRRRLTFIVQ